MNFPSVRNSEISCTFVNYSEYKILFQCMEDLSEPEFSVNTETTCTGFVAFTDESTNAPTAWKWDFGDGNTSTEQNPEHQYLENGTYSVSLTVTNLYGSNTITKEAFIIVEMPDPPVIDDIIVCEDEEFEIELDLEGTAYWYETVDSEEPVYVGNVWAHPPIEELTTYFLHEILKAPEGSVEEYCASLFRTEVHIIPETCVSIIQNQIDKITIVPNPSNGLFYIKGLTKGTDYRYVVTDISGKTVIENQSLNAELVDLSRLPDGVYFMTVSTGDEVRTLKLINMK